MDRGRGRIPAALVVYPAYPARLTPGQKGSWARNPIDRFILAGLERRGLQPAPEADRRTLARG